MSSPDPSADRDAAELRAFLADRSAECPTCGYDLRGVRESVCPECGAKTRLGLIGTPPCFRRTLIPRLGMVIFVVVQSLRASTYVFWWKSFIRVASPVDAVFILLELVPIVVGIIAVVKCFRIRAPRERAWWWAGTVLLVWGLATIAVMAVGWARSLL